MFTSADTRDLKNQLQTLVSGGNMPTFVFFFAKFPELFLNWKQPDMASDLFSGWKFTALVPAMNTIFQEVSEDILTPIQFWRQNPFLL